MTEKILILAYEAMPNSGTEAGLAEKWGRVYANRGYRVTIVSSGPADSAEITENWDSSIYEVVRLGNGTHAKAAQKTLQLVKNGLQYRLWIKQVQLFLLENSDWTIIHHVSWGSVRLSPAVPLGPGSTKTVWGPLGGGQVALFRGIQFRAWPQEVFRAMAFPISTISQKRRFRKRFTPTLTLTTNNETREFAEASGLARVEMMFADGIDPNDIVNSPRTGLAGRVRLVWMGRMVHTKRPDISLLLLRRLLDHGVEASLTMAGDGPELIRLRAMCERFDLTSSVNFLGKIPWSKVEGLYDTSDYLVFTSMRDSSSPSVLEAAGRGLPSLVLRHQGVGALVPPLVARGPHRWADAASLVESLATDVLAHLREPTLYTHASEQAISWAKQQTWERKVSTVLDHMEVRELDDHSL